MKFALTVALVLGTATVVAWGCAATPPAGLGVDDGNVTAVIAPHVGADRQLQAVIKPYDATSINHLDIQLWNGSTQVGNTKTLGGNPSGQIVTFQHLHQSTSYTIKAFAYLSSDNSVKISNDASSAATVNTAVAGGSQDNPTVSSGVPVVLINQTFDGTATGAVTVTPGVVNDTASTEAIL